MIESPNNIIFSYSSLASSPLKEGDKVKKGALIGYAGECDFGKELKSKHLHFEVYYNKTPINPLNVFNKDIVDSYFKNFMYLIKKSEILNNNEQSAHYFFFLDTSFI